MTCLNLLAETDGTLAMPLKSNVRAALGALGFALLAGCGGGGPAEDGDLVAQTERKEAQGLFDRLAVSWAPERINLDVTRGTTQSIQVTLTTTKALRDARVVFLPDLRNAVTVSPSTIPAIAAGQSATVTVTFAPATNDARKLIAGVVFLIDGNKTASRPLLVHVRLQDRAPFVNSTGGYQFVPPTGWQVVESGAGLTTLIPPGRAPNVENDYLGDIFVEPQPNPNNLSLADFYAQRGLVNLFAASAQQTPMTVNGVEAVRFDGVVGMLPSTVVAFRFTGRIVEIIDYGGHTTDGVLDALVSGFAQVR